jgi:hypothetical protein
LRTLAARTSPPAKSPPSPRPCDPRRRRRRTSGGWLACPEPLDQCEELVRSFTCEGALVLDPFCGVGTIPIACARQGRRYLGIEIGAEYLRVARRRMKLLGRKGDEEIRAQK